VVAIWTGVVAVATVMPSAIVALSAVGAVESVTFAVKLNVLDADGIPEILPELFKVRPGGSVPLPILHE